MKNKLQSILCVVLLFSSISTFAQSKDDPKHENHFKQLAPINTDAIDIEFSDAHAQQEFCLVKLKITNKTNDFIFFNTEELTFKFDHGIYKPKQKQIIIKPKGSCSYLAKVTGDSNFHVESFTLEIEGLSRLTTNVTALKVDKFQVPANKNNFTVGDFKINLLKSKQETQETWLRFSCIYEGSKIGIVDPSNIIITTEKGEWANDFKKSKIILLQNGETKKFSAIFHIPGKILDMQFATMHIDWKETFKESELEEMNGHKLNFEFDQGITSGKNK